MKNRPMQILESNINAGLAALATDRRPKHSATRLGIRSVAYVTGSFFEATDSNGNTEFVRRETARQWIA